MSRSLRPDEVMPCPVGSPFADPSPVASPAKCAGGGGYIVHFQRLRRPGRPRFTDSLRTIRSARVSRWPRPGAQGRPAVTAQGAQALCDAPGPAGSRAQRRHSSRQHRDPGSDRAGALRAPGQGPIRRRPTYDEAFVAVAAPHSERRSSSIWEAGCSQLSSPSMRTRKGSVAAQSRIPRASPNRSRALSELSLDPPIPRPFRRRIAVAETQPVIGGSRLREGGLRSLFRGNNRCTIFGPGSTGGAYPKRHSGKAATARWPR
jgi:hypothetical protein